ncbi:MAG: hypothetical protein CMP59_10020 [Flavobacteriales bacterium]|nr:hypothetical protein [Flavobacteriales bacterium]|tara:strand:+ start:2529 stop:3668 length:1140 start_codon:yes stop_codon:yes gene_type:complete
MKSSKSMHHLALILTGLGFSHLMLLISMLLLNYNEFFVSDHFFRWDSGNYLLIAEKGLFADYCNGVFSEMLREPFRCGSAGWSPAYPYLIRWLTYIVKDAALAGMILSKFFFILNLYFFTILARLDEFKIKGILLVLCFTVFFGSIYYHAIFPISQFIFFALGSFYAMRENKIHLVALLSFAACLTYSTGFLLGAALSLALFIQHFNNLRDKLFRVIIPAIGSIAALLSHFVILHFQTGHWNAFFLVQKRYGHKLSNPLDKVVQIFEPLMESSLGLTSVINLQSLLVLMGFGLISFHFFKRKLYKDPLLIISYCYLSVYLLFPYLIGSDQLSLYRAESLLIPMLFFVSRLQLRWIIFVFILLTIINLPMNHLFFKEILV